MTKALVMFSGGLDGLIAIKILEKQGIECTALTFTSPFFSKEKAEEQSKKFNLKFMHVDITEPHFLILQNPIYGHGKNLNPCIDCHGLMFRIAGEIADKKGFNIIASGEVLGQRPMSQNKSALNAVRKLAARDILRPLSAKLLPKTSYELEGLVDRSQLLSISGRSRKSQMQLAEEFGIQGFMSPGGGCILTEHGYTNKLKSLFSAFPKEILPIDAEIIKYSKLEIFDWGYLMVGKDNETNQKIISTLSSQKEKSQTRYQIFVLKDFTGPVCVVRNIAGNNKFLSDCKNVFRQRVKKLKNLPNFDLVLYDF